MADKPQAPVLTAWLTSLGDAAMATQRHLLEGHLEAVAAYAGTDGALRRIDPSLAAQVAPPELLVQEMTADLQVDLKIDRSHGFDLAVQPLGSGYQRRFSTSSEGSTRLSFTVRPTSHPQTSVVSPRSE